MFRNILAATLRNLARNRLYAAISIGGLAIGMAVALLTALFVRDELTFDRFIPGDRDIYVLVNHFDVEGLRGYAGQTPPEMAAPFQMDFPQAKTVVRYGTESRTLTRGLIEANETVAWVDPDFFDLFRFRTLAGDLQSAERQPDGLVLTRAAARRYFGVDAPIGQTLLVGRRTPFKVTAVIEDLPGNSNFKSELFLPGASAVSPYSMRAAAHMTLGAYGVFGRIYFRLADQAQAAAINKGLASFVDRRVFPSIPGAPKTLFAKGVTLAVIPDGDLHLMKDVVGPEVPPGDLKVLAALGAIAGLIVVIAAINFLNLMTARAARRAVEVGVRKAAGAQQRHLVAQFIGESVLHGLLAAVLALAMAELLLPGVNAVLQRQVTLDYWREPAVLSFAIGLGLLVGAMAGVYPALVLSAFRPAEVLKGLQAEVGGSTLVRQGLVTLQFAVLVGLLLSVIVIRSQTHFAMTKATGMDTDQVLRIGALCIRPGEAEHRALVGLIAKLPGVAGAACSSSSPLGAGDFNDTLYMPGGRQLNAGVEPIDFGFFELYGVKLLAGRLPSPAHGADSFVAPPGFRGQPHSPPNITINAGLARAMGFVRPEEAIGKSFRVQYRIAPASFETQTVTGVVADTQFDLTLGPPKPSIYPVWPQSSTALSVKIKGDRLPETLAAIDRIWKKAGDPRPIARRFTDEFLNTVYAGAIRQGWLIEGLAAVAVLIACLGLFGLAAFTTDQRTKEIGVRKAMGASRPDIIRLLLWSFTQPVLWANLIAWPLGWWAMDQWLHGFSARIPLSPWMFLLAGGAALIVAAATVSAQALRVAQARPVKALRYE